MGFEKYQILFLMFLTLQRQFTSFIEHQPERMEETTLDLDYLNLDMDMYQDLQEGRTNQQAVDLNSDWLNQLTELEEQTLVLEERLRRAQGRLKKLQAELRAAIETLEVKGKSKGRYLRRIIYIRQSMLEQKKQVRERSPLRFRSSPNIPSILEDLEFDILRKSVSLNRTIVFKDSLEDMLEAINNYLNFLDMSGHYTMMKLKKTSDFPMCQSTEQAAGQGNKSDSSGVRETARNATSYSSDQSGQHHVNAMHMGHSDQHRNVSEISHSGASAQPDNESHSPRVKKRQLIVHNHPINSTPRTRIQRRPSLRIPRAHSVMTTATATATTNAAPICGARGLSQRIPRAHSVMTTATATATTNAAPTCGARGLSQRILRTLNLNTTDTATTTITVAPNSRERIQSTSLQNVSEISHSGASAQPDNESHSPRVKKVNHEKVPTTDKKTKSSGSPSFSLTNISTAIYKTMAASCAAIFIFI